MIDNSKTLRKGLQVMDILLAAPEPGLRVAEICRASQLERATVHRLLATLLECGYATRVDRFHYGPSEKWNALALPAKQRADLAFRIAPVLAEVSGHCGDASFAVVREGGLSHCIARHVGNYPVQALVIQVGNKQPLGVGAAGLALLAALSTREIGLVIEANQSELPMYGNMSADGLRRLVQATQERGWSVVGNHATKGILAVGMPIFEANRKLLGGLSVSSTEERMPVARQRKIARCMQQALANHGFVT